jgi:hypothetical protein
MERGLLGTSLNGSPLVDLLARLALLEAPSARPSFVEGLGQWLGWTDAIPLAAALNAPPDPRPAPDRAHGPSTPGGTEEAPAAREFARVRAALERAIADDGTPGSAVQRPGRRTPGTGEPPAADTDFPPYRRRYVDLQHTMDARIAPLRAQARAAVAQRSPAMGRLAAIDAVLDDALRARQQGVLATLPALLETHFKRLRRADEDAGAAPHATPPRAPWLTVFRKDMQRLLLAELDLRLQPVQGLIDALRTP